MINIAHSWNIFFTFYLPTFQNITINQREKEKRRFLVFRIKFVWGWRARWDLNPGFSAPEADALSVLDYEPTTAQTKQTR
jgi:hypothetical protein